MWAQAPERAALLVPAAQATGSLGGSAVSCVRLARSRSPRARERRGPLSTRGQGDPLRTCSSSRFCTPSATSRWSRSGHRERSVCTGAPTPSATSPAALVVRLGERPRRPSGIVGRRAHAGRLRRALERHPASRATPFDDHVTVRRGATRKSPTVRADQRVVGRDRWRHVAAVDARLRLLAVVIVAAAHRSHDVS